MVLGLYAKRIIDIRFTPITRLNEIRFESKMYRLLDLVIRNFSSSLRFIWERDGDSARHRVNDLSENGNNRFVHS